MIHDEVLKQDPAILSHHHHAAKILKSHLNNIKGFQDHIKIQTEKNQIVSSNSH